MADDEPDRLSQLPDEILQHILHLAPCREAESTAVLSRRWRGLWPLPTGAIKIDIPSASFRDADEALAASHGPVERLSIVVGKDCDKYVDVVDDVLSHPASRGVQDVRIRARPSRGRRTAASSGDDDDDDDSCSWPRSWRGGEFQFRFVSVPSAALRVLHITNCSDYDLGTPPPLSTVFPCLEVLRLRRCMVTLQMLQDMVMASPQLAALQLEHVCLLLLRENGRSVTAQSLCCPTITTLVLLNCNCEPRDRVAIELEVPRVQHYKFIGNIIEFTLRSPLPDVRRMYLHIHDSYRIQDDEKCESFWNYLKHFSNTKVLKLKLEWDINYVAAREKGRISDLQIAENESAQSIMFCVEHLEIDVQYNPLSKDTGMAIGNFLQCCPILHDLRLKLNNAHQRRRGNKTQLEFDKSIDHFRHRRDRPVLPLCGEDGKFEVSDIPGLSDRWIHFSCLRLHLRKLSLQFHMEDGTPNCIGIQLVKFFIKTGMALEEIYINDGNMKMWEHINCKISGYTSNPQPISEYQLFARMSQVLSMNQFTSLKINGCFHTHKLEVRRTNPWLASKSFPILPLADT